MTHNFTSNGLKHANRLLGYEAFNPDIWKAVGQYDRKRSRHQAFVTPEIDVTVEGANIKKGEKVRIEESHKWPFRRAERLWYEACAKNSVIEGSFFSNSGGNYCKPSVAYFLLRNHCLLPLNSNQISRRFTIIFHQLIAYSPTFAQSVQNDCFIEARTICCPSSATR